MSEVKELVERIVIDEQATAPYVSEGAIVLPIVRLQDIPPLAPPQSEEESLRQVAEFYRVAYEAEQRTVQSLLSLSNATRVLATDGLTAEDEQRLAEEGGLSDV